MARNPRGPLNLTVAIEGEGRLLNKLHDLPFRIQREVVQRGALYILNRKVKTYAVNILNTLGGMGVIRDSIVIEKLDNGAQLRVDSKRLFYLYRKRYGFPVSGLRESPDVPYYYLWVTEYGSPRHTAYKPFRRAVQSSHAHLRSVFRKYLHRVLKSMFKD